MTSSKDLRAAPVVARVGIRGEKSVRSEISIDLPSQRGERILTVTTSKWSRGICAIASVSTHEPGGIMTHAIGFGVSGDFSVRLPAVEGRATEKALRNAHEAALLSERGQNIVEEARAWYEKGMDVHPVEREQRIAERIAKGAAVSA